MNENGTIEKVGDLYINRHKSSFGDPSAFLNNFTEKERNEIRKKMREILIEDGYYTRKDVWEKQHSIYKNDELFYGM
jgi:hypothetical protein